VLQNCSNNFFRD